jgi:Family of unknown function (DUF6519)
MSFDCSRFRFDPEQDYFGVVMQQGRVQLDADWNDWVAQVARRIQAGTLDSLGPAAVPWETPNGFRIQVTDGDLTIGPGRIYVDGILVENHGAAPRVWNPRLAEREGTGAVAYSYQPYLPNPDPLPGTDGLHLVYLDVWRRDLTWLQSPELVEQAVGVDTTGRWQTVWQVKVLPAPEGSDCVLADPTPTAWTEATRPSAGRLSTATGTPPGTAIPVLVPPAAGYKGLENQLYRVEIHQGGGPDTATFKWSRDNATVATPVSAIPALDRVTVESLGRDDLLRFRDGDWVEVTDDWRELKNLPGELRRILPYGGVDDATRTLRLTAPLPDDFFPVDAEGRTDPLRHTRLRRWDQAGPVLREDGIVVLDLNDAGAPGDIPVTAAGPRLFLEQGILVALDLDPAGGQFRSGDYWVFAARSVDASIEILYAAPPLGVHHHYAPLALVPWPDQAIDQRRPLLPATGQVQVCSVLHCDPDGRLRSLMPGQELPLDRLAEGFKVLIRQAVDAESVNDASLFVTAEIPYRLPAVELDVAENFNAPKNPSKAGEFSYGVGAKPEDFSPLSEMLEDLGGFPTLVLSKDVSPGHVAKSIVMWNGTGMPIKLSTVEQPPNVVRMDPQGSPGTIVRFTAPVAATYSVAGSFRSIDENFKGTKAELFAAKNSLWDATSDQVKAGAAFDRTVELAAGQYIDFVVVQSGTESSFLSTGLRARIAYAPAPVAYQPIVLPAEVRRSAPAALEWRPFTQTVSSLGDSLKSGNAWLSNARFESAFQVFDYGGAASKWGLGAGNLVVVQTEPLAGRLPAGAKPVLPTTAINRYQIRANARYIGLSVDTGDRSGIVGLVYNWENDKNYSIYFASKFEESHGETGGSSVVQISHARLLNGEIDPTSRRDIRVSESGGGTQVILDIKQIEQPQQLVFGVSLVGPQGFSFASTSVFVSPIGLPGKLLPGSRVGALTAETGAARFTRLQVVYGDGPTATLIPAGLSNKLLARLVLKRSLLQVADAQGVARGGAFAAPVPTPDHETWFWLTPPLPSYYGYRYGGGVGLRGIGAARLTAGQPQ